MSRHSYSRCWLHMTWGMKGRQPLLAGKDTRAKVSRYLGEYANTKDIYMKTNYVNADHVHCVIDLPSDMSIESAIKLLKGASSHWINQERVIPTRFQWQRGYGAFSVSQSRLDAACKYILAQEEHHRVKSYREEVELFVESHGLVWRDAGES